MTTARITDEVLSLTTAVTRLATTETTMTKLDPNQSRNTDTTLFILFLYPFYVGAILSNLLTIFMIFTSKIYRQYLCNILIAIISIGALMNAHGIIFIALLRWGDTSDLNILCSISSYFRDTGSILVYTHILIIASERILANIKKNPGLLNNEIVQNGHLALIALSLIAIASALFIPTSILRLITTSNFNVFCSPKPGETYSIYLKVIYYGFGYPCLIISVFGLVLFFTRRTTASYSDLTPINKMSMFISLVSCCCLLMSSIINGTVDEQTSEREEAIRTDYLLNIRDFCLIIEKYIIGIAFFGFRPEIRDWLVESLLKFRFEKRQEVLPQMLEIRGEVDDNICETDDGNLEFR